MSQHDGAELVPLATPITDRMRRDVTVQAALEGRPVQDLEAQASIEHQDNRSEPASDAT